MAKEAKTNQTECICHWHHLLLHLICHAGASEMEKTLMKNIFNGYNLKVRPAVKPEERVVVRVGMVLSSFVGLVSIPRKT